MQIYICVYIFTHTHTYIYIYICMYVYIYMYRYIYVYIYICMYIYIIIYVCIYIHTLAFRSICMCSYIYILIYKYVYIYTYIHIYVYVYIHIYTYQYIFMCVCVNVFRCILWMCLCGTVCTTFCLVAIFQVESEQLSRTELCIWVQWCDECVCDMHTSSAYTRIHTAPTMLRKCITSFESRWEGVVCITSRCSGCCCSFVLSFVRKQKTFEP